jgi:hypothetical protein
VVRVALHCGNNSPKTPVGSSLRGLAFLLLFFNKVRRREFVEAPAQGHFVLFEVMSASQSDMPAAKDTAPPGDAGARGPPSGVPAQGATVVLPVRPAADDPEAPPAKRQARGKGKSKGKGKQRAEPAKDKAARDEQEKDEQPQPREKSLSTRDKFVRFPCALLYPGDDSKVLAASAKLGQPDLIGCELIFVGNDMSNPHIELRLLFPRGKDQTSNEASGFGVVYSWNAAAQDVQLSDSHCICLELSRAEGSVDIGIMDVTDTVKTGFPSLAGSFKAWTMVQLTLLNEDSGAIKGYGLPFKNADSPLLDGWVAENMALPNGMTVLELLSHREFMLLVPQDINRVRNDLNPERLPQPLEYPYGHSFTWKSQQELESIQALIRGNRGKEFVPRFSFGSITEHLMCVAQSCLQDVMWQCEDAQAIESSVIYAYMAEGIEVPRDNERYVIVHMPQKLPEVYEQTWNQLTRVPDSPFKLLVYTLWDDKEHSGEWDCKIINHPERIDELANHQVTSDELVLLVRIPKDKKGNPDFAWRKYASHDMARTAFGDPSKCEP